MSGGSKYENSPKGRATRKRWAEEHPENVARYNREWASRNREKRKTWAQENHEKVRAYKRKHWAKYHPPGPKPTEEQKRRNRRARNARKKERQKVTPTGRLKLIFGRRRRSAIRNGREFLISIDDLVMPTHCPILGLPLGFARDTPLSHRPSLDRSDNSRGYERGNVQIVSFRANTLKSDATVDEIRKLLAYMELIELAS